MRKKYELTIVSLAFTVLLILSVVLLVVLLAGCHNEKAMPEGMVTEVRCVEAVMSPIADDLVSYGTVSFKTKNDVAALVDGNVSAVEVKEGDELRSGDVLLRLSNPQLMIQREQAQNAVDQARSALAVAQNKLWESRFSIEGRLLAVERSDITIAQKELEAQLLEADLDASRELFALGGVTRMALEQQELSLKGTRAEMAVYQNDRRISELGLTAADLRGAGIVPGENFREQVIGLNLRGNVAEVKAAELAAQNATENLTAVDALVAALDVRAPVDGVVGARYYELGEYVKQNEKVVTLIDLTQVYASFYIQEQDMVNFTLGSPLSITVMSLDLTLGARIDEIAPMADSTSGNFAVKALLDNGGAGSAEADTVLGNLRPGMFVRCVLPRGDGGECVTVPESALATAQPGKVTVFVVRGDVAVMLEVVLRRDSLREGLAYVESGLEAGDRVIDKPSPFLQDGSPVHVSD
jgi:RND family efflux transporter MFP subunit